MERVVPPPVPLPPLVVLVHPRAPAQILSARIIYILLIHALHLGGVVGLLAGGRVEGDGLAGVLDPELDAGLDEGLLLALVEGVLVLGEVAEEGLEGVEVDGVCAGDVLPLEAGGEQREQVVDAGEAHVDAGDGGQEVVAGEEGDEHDVVDHAGDVELAGHLHLQLLGEVLTQQLDVHDEQLLEPQTAAVLVRMPPLPAQRAQAALELPDVVEVLPQDVDPEAVQREAQENEVPVRRIDGVEQGRVPPADEVQDLVLPLPWAQVRGIQNPKPGVHGRQVELDGLRDVALQAAHEQGARRDGVHVPAPLLAGGSLLAQVRLAAHRRHVPPPPLLVDLRARGHPVRADVHVLLRAHHLDQLLQVAVDVLEHLLLRGRRPPVLWVRGNVDNRVEVNVQHVRSVAEGIQCWGNLSRVLDYFWVLV